MEPSRAAMTRGPRRSESIPQLGVTLGHTAEPVRQSQELARYAETSGLDIIGFGDSETVFRELYTQLTACALVTERIAIGSVVTNCRTRVPAVTASAISSIQELSGGRAFLGIGLGQSATAGAHLARGTPAELADYVSAIRAAHGSTDPGGGGLGASRLSWDAPTVPLMIHASRPKSIEVAIRLGDGVILRYGDVGTDALRERLALIRRSVGQTRDNHRSFRIWLFSPGAVADTAADATSQVEATVSARAVTVKDDECPPDLRPALAQYRERYSYRHHASTREPVNAEALRALGLFEYMAGRLALVGTRQELDAQDSNDFMMRETRCSMRCCDPGFGNT